MKPSLPCQALLLATLCLGCGQSRPLRDGLLADGADVSLGLGAFEGRWRLVVSNRDAHGGCLRYASLAVFVDGKRQAPVSLGGKSVPSKTGIDEECDGAVFEISAPHDPAREHDVIEVRDSSRSMRMEIPNLLSPYVLRVLTPPEGLRAGAPIALDLQPPPPPEVQLGFGMRPSLPQGPPLHVEGGRLSTKLPAGLAPGPVTLWITGVGKVTPISCTAAICQAEASVDAEATAVLLP